MGNCSGLGKKLNKFSKQCTALLLVLALTIPQNLFANNPSDKEPNDIPAERFNFSEALSPQEINTIGVAPGELQFINTTGLQNGKTIDLDVIRGQFKAKDSEKILEVLNQLKSEIEESYRLNPNTKFEFVHIADENEKNVDLTATEILEILKDINNETNAVDVKIESSKAAKFKSFFAHLFDKTSKSDIYWSLARVAGSGTSAYVSFHYGSGFPIPVSIALAGVLGAGSGSIGLFIEKFTGWLEHNKATPEKGVRNYLGSLETYMLLSPALIGLQSDGLVSVEGAALLAGTAAAGVIVQSAYYMIKKRFPGAAMWYKWYATEALFLTVPYLAMPAWDIYSGNIKAAIISTFVTALASTASQGVWDVLITKKLRGPKLEAAMKADIAELADKLSGRHIYVNNPEALAKVIHEDELRTRVRFTTITKIASYLPGSTIQSFVEKVKASRIDAAVQRDLAQESERLLGKNIFNLSKSDLNKLTHEQEFRVRERYKKYFFIASIISVASAVATNTGVYTGIDALKYAGITGLGVLGLSGVFTWVYLDRNLGKAVAIIAAASTIAYEVGKRTGTEFVTMAGEAGLAAAAAGALTWAFVKYKDWKAKKIATQHENLAPNSSQGAKRSSSESGSFSEAVLMHTNSCRSLFH